MISDYLRYITSTRWRNSVARQEELRRAGKRCRLCNQGPPDVVLEVHHRSYNHFTREHVEDLTTLCSECHYEVTNLLRRRRYAGQRQPIISEVRSVVPGRRLIDRTSEA